VSTIDVAEFKRLLDDHRAKVVGALEYLQRENPGSMEDEGSESPLDNHLAENATLTLDREIDYTLQGNEEEVLHAIDAALQRIEDGTYGVCPSCGKPIPEERLRAIPYAKYCIDCQRKVRG
jgi:DnaK suppressor protein